MRKFIIKMLGLPNKEQIEDLKNELLIMGSKYDDAVELIARTRHDMSVLKADMKALYAEVSSDIRRVDNKVSKIKSILKIQDEEAVKFIKGILSKHDIAMKNNQTDLENRAYQIASIKKQAENAVDQASKASSRLNNILNSLGMMPEYNPESLMETFRSVVIKNGLDKGSNSEKTR